MFIDKNDDSFELCDVELCEIFIAKATTQNTFSLKFETKDGNCKITIYETDCLQKDGEYKTGDEVALICPELYCEVDVWNKYFFPKFTKDMYQWYHPEIYSNDIQAMAEVLEYARKRAIELINK